MLLAHWVKNQQGKIVCTWEANERPATPRLIAAIKPPPSARTIFRADPRRLLQVA